MNSRKTNICMKLIFATAAIAAVASIPTVILAQDDEDYTQEDREELEIEQGDAAGLPEGVEDPSPTMPDQQDVPQEEPPPAEAPDYEPPVYDPPAEDRTYNDPVRNDPVRATAPNRSSPVANEPATEETTATGESAGPIELPKTVERKSFTQSEKKKICQQYDGGYIAYYGDVFKVEDCKRRPILANKTLYDLMQTGIQLRNVDSDIIAALPEGKPLDYAMTVSEARGCSDLEGKYVSFGNVDVYYVEKCKKRKLPDWVTYLDHRNKRGEQYGPIISLSWLEISRLAQGSPIESIANAEFAKIMVQSLKEVDVLPIDEACGPVEGKIVFYYSKLYKIEGCRKREMVPQDYFKLGSTEPKVEEMTSEQWLSIPDGVPLDDAAATAKSTAGRDLAPISSYQH